MPSKPRDTKLTRELAAAKLPSGTSGKGSVAIERLQVKKDDRVEIRFSRWEGTRMMPRALSLPEEELLPLLEAGIREGVFSDQFTGQLRRALGGATPDAGKTTESRPAGDLARIEGHFHDLIRARAAGRLGEQASSLPRLEAGTGTEDEPVWFPVDGMDGGFKYWWDSSAQGPRLMSESWSRTVAGSGQLHEVTPDGSRLLAEGFV
jgi:hypothetical protein